MSIGSIGSSGGSSLSLIQQWQQKIFSSIDSDGNGSITKTELESAVTKAGGTTGQADALYSQLDPNDTGSVSESQFSANMPVPMLSPQMMSQLISYQSGDGSDSAGSVGGIGGGNPGAQIASDLFSSIDTDGDGSITKSELESAVTSAGGTTDEADALYAKLDPDNTGSVRESTFAQDLQPPPSSSSDSDTSSDGSTDGASATASSTSIPSSGDTAALDALKALIEALESSNPDSSTADSSSSTGSTSSSSASTTSAAADDALKALLDALQESAASSTGSSANSDSSSSNNSGSNSDNNGSLAGAALQNLLHYYAAAGNLMTPDFTSSMATSA